VCVSTWLNGGVPPTQVSVDAPWIEVDTTDGYRPGLRKIVAFINDPG
jgi:hypothetical protein